MHYSSLFLACLLKKSRFARSVYDILSILSVKLISYTIFLNLGYSYSRGFTVVQWYSNDVIEPKVMSTPLRYRRRCARIFIYTPSHLDVTL
jgi:hypothetical protein